MMQNLHDIPSYSTMKHRESQNADWFGRSTVSSPEIVDYVFMT